MTDEPMDIATVTADAALFDALAADEPVPADDDVAAMLAAWRADLTDDDMPTVRKPFLDEPEPVVAVTPIRPSRRRRLLLAAAAAAAVAAGGATAAAASQAGPDSPLWPITRVIFPDRAESRTAQQQAEQAIDRARDAVDQSRYSDADKLLDEATSLIDDIEDQTVADRLLAEVAAIRGLLPGLPNVPGLPGGATAPPSGGVPQRTPGPTPGAPNGGGGSTAPGTGGGLPLPSLPSLPITTPPLPSLPLPSLPLPTKIL